MQLTEINHACNALNDYSMFVVGNSKLNYFAFLNIKHAPFPVCADFTEHELKTRCYFKFDIRNFIFNSMK